MKINKILMTGILPCVLISQCGFYSRANSVYNLNSIITKESNFNAEWVTEGFSKIDSEKYNFTISELNGKIYMIGDMCTSSFTPSQSFLTYDIEKNEWNDLYNYGLDRMNMSSIAIDNKLYCFGGQEMWNGVNKVQAFDVENNTWEDKAPIPEKYGKVYTILLNNFVYCLGGETGSAEQSKTLLKYDINNNSWSEDSNIPSDMIQCTGLEVIGDKLYCFGKNTANEFILNVYDTVSKSWESKKSPGKYREDYSVSALKGKLYMFGGYGNGEISDVEEYNPVSDSWSKLCELPQYSYHLDTMVYNGEIYCILGNDGGYTTIQKLVLKEKSQEDIANSAVDKAEEERTAESLNEARNLVNALPEGDVKKGLQARLNAIMPNNITFTKESASANVDVYIKSENMLSLSLNTNSITFDDFGGTEDLVEENAVVLTVNSSLPYKVNASLATEIQNAAKDKTMDKEILNIKANGELDSTYQHFAAINTPIEIIGTQQAGNGKTHGIDIKLKGGIPHEKDIYKTTIKFEATQK